MKKRFSEEQIIDMLKEYRSGIKSSGAVPETWHKRSTYYNWKTKFGGMAVSDAATKGA